MTGFILRRVAAAIPLLLATSFIVFTFLHLAPGDPETTLLGGRNVDQATIQAIRSEYHLNDPFLAQYWFWLRGVTTGDFGQSIQFRDSVASVVVPRIGPTVELAAYALVLIVCVGLPLGVVTGARRSSAVDNVVSSIGLIGSSVATYVSGILLIAIFGVALGWFPVFGLGSGGLDRIYHLTLPAIALSVALVALVQRTTRVALAEVLDQDFVQTARSRGFRERRVVAKHGIRSALIPVVTITGLIFGYLISGAVLVEYTFGLNGLGGLLVQSVQNKDFAVVQAITLLFTVAFIAVNLVVTAVCDCMDRLGGDCRAVCHRTGGAYSRSPQSGCDRPWKFVGVPEFCAPFRDRRHWPRHLFAAHLRREIKPFRTPDRRGCVDGCRSATRPAGRLPTGGG